MVVMWLGTVAVVGDRGSRRTSAQWRSPRVATDRGSDRESNYPTRVAGGGRRRQRSGGALAKAMRAHSRTRRGKGSGKDDVAGGPLTVADMVAVVLKIRRGESSIVARRGRERLGFG